MYKKSKEDVSRHNKTYYKKNKEAVDKRNKEYALKNKKKIAAYKKEYRRKNKDAISKMNKDWRDANKEHVSEVGKKWRTANPEHRKEWMSKHPGKHNEYSKTYYKNNEHIREHIKKYSREWRQANIEKVRENAMTYYYLHKTEFAWRRILKSSLKRLGGKKSGSTIELLGYSADELKNHITSLLKEGMSWDNYGDWHIDHVKAVTNFPTDTPPHIVNALSNLQPLWAHDNFVKGDRDI